MRILLLLLLVLLPSMACSMVFPDKMMEGAKECTQYMEHNEKKYQLPHYILPAISMAETGRWNKAFAMQVPWPWTINVEGKSMYFDTKAEAIETVKTLQAQGKKLIDVGCMQVNLHYHGKAFKDLETAFDPESNVEYAAKFLKENFKKVRDWDAAVKIYHSYDVERGEVYLTRVYSFWDMLERKIFRSGTHSDTYQKYTAVFGKRELKKRNTGDLMVYQAKPRKKTGIVVNSSASNSTSNKVKIF